MNPRSSSRSKAPAAGWQRPLLIEMLEARQMLSVSIVRGALMIDGTSGNDTITVSRDPVTKGQLRVSINGLLNGVDGFGLKRINISALEGNDLVFIDPSHGAIDLPVNIAGGSGNDTMTGGSGADVLQGGRGNDVIHGSAGRDLLEGGTGNDDLFGGDGRDTLDGGAGNDSIYTGGYRREVVYSDAQDAVDRSVPSYQNNTKTVGTLRPNFFNGFVTGLTPDVVRSIYGIDGIGLTGAGQTIAIVDAFDNPTVRTDLQTFSTEFGLPDITKDNFQVYYATKQRPNYDGSAETSLDVQWAHAIAPDAKIVLVEANSLSFPDLYQGIDRAAEIVASLGGGVVSMSFGGGEQFTDPLNELHFHNENTPSVSFINASGDFGAQVSDISNSTYVTSVGGTFLDVDPNTGALLSPESGWTGSGGGISSFFPRPDFQAGVTIDGAPLNNRRALPDVAFLADPRSGVAVYDTSPDSIGFTGWRSVGGTSLACPMFAAFVTLANQQRATMGKVPIGSALNTAIYNAARDPSDYAANFNDITSGTNGYSTYVGYDLVTGLGSPKPALVTALANDDTMIATGNVIFSAARLSVGTQAKLIFGGTGSASKSGNSWDLDLVPNARSGVSIALDGPLSPNSNGQLTTTGMVTIVLDATHSQSYLIRAVAREENGQLIGEFYAVSSRGHIIYQGNKVAFYGTFHT